MSEFSDNKPTNENSEWDELAGREELAGKSAKEEATYVRELKTRDGFTEKITANSQEELDEKVKEFYEGEAERWAN